MSLLHLAIKAVLYEGCMDATRRMREARKKDDICPLDPMTVVDNYGRLVIVTSGKNRQFLHPDGYEDDYRYHARSTKPVSDEQVEQCLDNLTKAQIKYILYDDTVFAPVLSALLEEDLQADPSTINP